MIAGGLPFNRHFAKSPESRAFITRGDYLIRLGLSSRKVRDEDSGDGDSEDAVSEEQTNDEAEFPVAAPPAGA